jgi:hypothetical protein
LRFVQAGGTFFEQIRTIVKSCACLPVRVVASVVQAKIASWRCEKPRVCRLSRRTGRSKLGYNLVLCGSAHHLRALKVQAARTPGRSHGENFPHASEANIHGAT